MENRFRTEGETDQRGRERIILVRVRVMVRVSIVGEEGLERRERKTVMAVCHGRGSPVECEAERTERQ